jgi:hypothetical protein
VVQIRSNRRVKLQDSFGHGRLVWKKLHDSNQVSDILCPGFFKLKLGRRKLFHSLNGYVTKLYLLIFMSLLKCQLLNEITSFEIIVQSSISKSPYAALF